MDVLRGIQVSIDLLKNVLCLLIFKKNAAKIEFSGVFLVHRAHDIGSSIVGQPIGRYIRLKACYGINVVVDFVIR